MNRRTPSAAAVTVTALAAAVIGAAAAAQPTITTPFTVARETPPGVSVFVSGDLPALGANDVRRAVKLVETEPNLWSVPVELPAGVEHTYRFVEREHAPGRWGDAANAVFFGDPISETTPAGGAHEEPLVIYEGDAAEPQLIYQAGGFGSPQTIVPMTDAGPGRREGDRRWIATGLPDPRLVVARYVIRDAATGAVESKFSHLVLPGRTLVQDGEAFRYLPAASVSPPRKDYDPADPPTFFVPATGETRPYRVFLPRGYDEHTAKRYPVLYMHDGQNVLEPGAFGDWLADESATRAALGADMREVIIVGIDHTNRARDYLPPEDGFAADAYTAAVETLLMPIINSQYRTLTGPEHTASAGSSFGGVAAIYQGFARPDLFGLVGAFSPSGWAMPAFRAEILAGERNAAGRVYLDSGDAGGGNDGFTDTLGIRDGLLDKPDGYAVERELRHAVGFGQVHNESAWSQRLPGCLAFLFPPPDASDGLDALPVGLACNPADLDASGDLTFGDVSAFIAAFNAGASAADINGDGLTNFGDVSAFIAAFGEGCP